jgi:hypothetical protein
MYSVFKAEELKSAHNLLNWDKHKSSFNKLFVATRTCPLPKKTSKMTH